MVKVHNILFSDDGIEPEVMAEAVKVFKVFESPQHHFQLHQELIEGCSIDEKCKLVTEEVKQAVVIRFRCSIIHRSGGSELG